MFVQNQMRVLILCSVNSQVLAKKKKNPLKSARNNILSVKLLHQAFAFLLPKLNKKDLNLRRFGNVF